MVRLLMLLLLAWAGVAWADEAVVICFNYGCASEATAVFSEAQLAQVAERLRLATSAEQERALLALAMGSLYGWAGEQTPIHADRAGNMADEGRRGSMDCIDHSLTSERFLKLLERRGMLHFHRVVGRIRRVRYLVMEHNAVQIQALWGLADAAKGGDSPARYVVDSWYVNNGEPALIMPLQNWLDGEGPDV